MKLGIITLLGDNYGNRLQNYAVQEILKEYADEVYTIKYEKKVPVSNGKKTSLFSKFSPSYISLAVKSRLKNIYHMNVSSRSLLSNVLYFF